MEYFSAFTMRGLVYVKKSADEPAFRINDFDQLHHSFPAPGVVASTDHQNYET